MNRLPTWTISGEQTKMLRLEEKPGEINISGSITAGPKKIFWSSDE